MKILATLSLICLCLNGCKSQEKKEISMETQQRIKYIENNIKKFDYEPLYQIKVKTNNCYQILINDFPVYSYYDELSGKIGFNINSAILKSGEQDLEIRIFPSYIEGDLQNEYLSSKDYFTLEIQQTAWDKQGSLEKPKVIFSYERPEKDSLGEYVNYNNLKYYKEKFTFNANVPYELTGWSESEDLTKVEGVKDKALNFYKKVIESFNRKDYDLFNTLYLKADNEWYQSEYFPLTTIEKYQNSLYKNNFEGLSIYKLENFRVSFYCNNRIIALESLSGKNRGNSSFAYEYINNSGMKVAEWNNLFLHIPKGKTELEIIR
jgi:hypothetical protein